MKKKLSLIIIFTFLGCILNAQTFSKNDRNNESLLHVEKYGCPHCNSEYQSHIEVCADCNNHLAFYFEELIK